MPRVLEIAIQTALGRRGVSVISLPGDIALKEAPVSAPRVAFAQPPTPSIQPSAAELARLAALLNKAQRVTILAGAGCARAHAELLKTAGKLQAAIVHALRGKEHVEYDNPFDVGMTGLLGFPPATTR